MSKTYVIRDDKYIRLDASTGQVDPGYGSGKPLGQGWAGLAGAGFDSGIDGSVDIGDGYVYLFKGANYVKVDQTTNTVVQPAVRSIGEAWGIHVDGQGSDFVDAGFDTRIDAAVNWGDGKAYFFSGQYWLQYDIATDAVDEVELIVTDNGDGTITDWWPGFQDAGMSSGVDAAVEWGSGGAVFFLDDVCVHYRKGSGVEGDPHQISGDDWMPGLGASGFTDVIATAWTKRPGGSTPPPPSSGGHHVWFWNGMVSTDQWIPRLSWFRDAVPPVRPNDDFDFANHGKEIYCFVRQPDGTIRRGQPHMRVTNGSFAWLNNNPGNLTAPANNAVDIGQYPGEYIGDPKHRFHVFPDHQTGYDAIPRWLKAYGYWGKSILDTMKAYAPDGDGPNSAGQYAKDVALAAGVSTSTLIGNLSTDQMRKVQDKIESIEGTVVGPVWPTSLPAAQMPQVVVDALS